MKSYIKNHFVVYCLCVFLSPSVFSLVEYSDESSFRPVKSGVVGKSKNIKVKKRKRVSSKIKRNSYQRRKKVKKHMASLFDFTLGHESYKASLSDGEGTVGFYTVDGRFQVDPDLYLDIGYWHTAGTKGALFAGDGEKKGNTTFKLGLNWFRVGDPAYQAVVNFYGGAMLPVKNSIVASSRLDKMVGIETSKRFENFLLALGFDMRLTGSPANANEMYLGNINTIVGGST
ncbi:MAG: hypothetical protein OXB84_00535 [Halobacteriovoraceae bacterium]|nr:hypothetical protein [Halobacteriovoraceae bacterium]